MNKPCKYSSCVGCYSCKQICPKQCISVSYVKYQKQIKIDESRCIECGLCAKHCPCNKELPKRLPSNAYAVWLKNDIERRRCASGGFATMLSKYFVSKGYNVYATTLDDDQMPTCRKIKNLDDIENFKGSRYVQSNIDGIYSKIKEDLELGTKTLLIGTPCQIAGLYSYLDKEYENLYTCDLICHGVCTEGFYREEINHYKGKQKITDVNFRSNDENNFHLVIKNENDIVYNQKNYSQFYFAGFLKSVTLNESCYTCSYSTKERISDFSIGDFIGAEKLGIKKESNTNVSLVMIMTPKAQIVFDEISKSDELHTEKRNYEEAVLYSPSLNAPAKSTLSSKLFHASSPILGYMVSSRLVLFPSVFYDRLHHKLFKIKQSFIKWRKKTSK